MLTTTGGLTLCFLVLAMSLQAAAADKTKPLRVLVWDEQQPEQSKAYENFLGNAIADYLRQLPGLRVISVNMAQAEQGLDSATLAASDVVVWWGHRKHAEVKADRVEELVARVVAGQLGYIGLHSAHFSQPFTRLMQERARLDAPQRIPESERATAKFDLSMPLQRGRVTPESRLTPFLDKVDGVWRLTPPLCAFPSWRADGEPSHVTTLLPDHPIAAGLPKNWNIPQTEMYSEPFHVPTPDAVVFEERWDKGEHFRSGSAWQVGKGRVFYYRPGHETFPIFRQLENLRVIENAVRWAAP